MLEWLYIVAVILVGLTLLYWMQLDRISTGTRRSARVSESYIDYITALEGPDSFLPNAGAFPEGPQVALKDYKKVKTGLTSMTAMSCAETDTARQGELGGQYVQRTNNYRRDYPDNCSAPLSEFVGSVYEPVSIGADVPCDGDC
jgi:hypothetical protein